MRPEGRVCRHPSDEKRHERAHHGPPVRHAIQLPRCGAGGHLRAYGREGVRGGIIGVWEGGSMGGRTYGREQVREHGTREYGREQVREHGSTGGHGIRIADSPR